MTDEEWWERNRRIARSIKPITADPSAGGASPGTPAEWLIRLKLCELELAYLDGLVEQDEQLTATALAKAHSESESVLSRVDRFRNSWPPKALAVEGKDEAALESAVLVGFRDRLHSVYESVAVGEVRRSEGENAARLRSEWGEFTSRLQEVMRREFERREAAAHRLRALADELLAA
jgi:hypothetical protein